MELPMRELKPNSLSFLPPVSFSIDNSMDGIFIIPFWARPDSLLLSATIIGSPLLLLSTCRNSDAKLRLISSTNEVDSKLLLGNLSSSESVNNSNSSMVKMIFNFYTTSSTSYYFFELPISTLCPSVLIIAACQDPSGFQILHLGSTLNLNHPYRCIFVSRHKCSILSYVSDLSSSNIQL